MEKVYEIGINEINGNKTVVAYFNNKFYTDIHATDYPSKKNVLGLSAYPFGFGTSIFLPERTRFFAAEGNKVPQWVRDEAKKIIEEK